LAPGHEPPPLSTDPMWYWRTSSGVIAEISGCVICPTFSASDIFDSSARTRDSTCLEGLMRLSTRGQSV